MKIKLMSIVLIAVWSLQGSEFGFSVKANPDKIIRQAFFECINSFNNGKAPLIVCFFNEMNNETLHNVTVDAVNDECKSIDKDDAKYMDVSLYSLAWADKHNEKIKNATRDVWEDLKKSKHKMLPAIMIYNISGAQLEEDIKNIQALIEKNKKAPLLITTTSVDATFAVRETVVDRGIQQLKGDRTLYFFLLAEATKTPEGTQTTDEQDVDAIGSDNNLSSSSTSKEDEKSSGDKSDDKKEQALLVSGEGASEIIGDPQATSPQQVDSTSGSQSINPQDQPSFMSNLKAFLTTNRWTIVGGVSLAALFAYYYNFVR